MWLFTGWELALARRGAFRVHRRGRRDNRECGVDRRICRADERAQRAPFSKESATDYLRATP
jgi:hypothetical protein